MMRRLSKRFNSPIAGIRNGHNRPAAAVQSIENKSENHLAGLPTSQRWRKNE